MEEELQKKKFIDYNWLTYCLVRYEGQILQYSSKIIFF